MDIRLVKLFKGKAIKHRPYLFVVVGAKHLGGDVSWNPRDGFPQVQGN